MTVKTLEFISYKGTKTFLDEIRQSLVAPVPGGRRSLAVHSEQDIFNWFSMNKIKSKNKVNIR